MSEEKAAPKIGVGPTGSGAALIQFIALTIFGLAAFTYLPSISLVATGFLPGSLVMLVWLGILAVAGGNWPLAPPAGRWKPGVNRGLTGLGMTVIWWIITAVNVAFMHYVYPKWPIFPFFLWFGVLAFWTTLLWCINWGCWPFAGRVKPWAMIPIAAIVIYLVASIMWLGLVNLRGTPLAGTPFDPGGLFPIDWLVGFLVWHIAWFFVFSPIFVTQGWPFRKLKQPGMAVAQTIVSFVLAYICWEGSLRIGISPTLSFGAVASSIVFWSLTFSWMFSFNAAAKYKQPKRGVLSFIAVIVITAVWVSILTLILSPLSATAAAAKLAFFDVNLAIIYFNLCVLAPALIAHNAFWLRAPLTLPAPPGTPPPDQGQ